MNKPLPPHVTRALLQDAAWMPFELLPETRESLWIQLNESILREASFIDQRILPKAQSKLRVPDGIFSATAANAQTLRYIFHCGHVGSTLLSRLLSQDDTVMPLREPQILRTLANQERELDQPWSQMARQEWWSRCDDILNLLGRPHRHGQHVLIKATSIGSNLLPIALSCRSDDRAIAIYTSLELYLAVMLRSPAALHDNQGFAVWRMKEFVRRCPSTRWRLHELQAAQVVALSWLVNLLPMLQATQENPGRCRLVDFSTLMAQPALVADEAAEFLHLPAPRNVAQETRRYAKDPQQPFDPERRRHELMLQMKQQENLFVKTLAWLRAAIDDDHSYATCLEYCRHPY